MKHLFAFIAAVAMALTLSGTAQAGKTLTFGTNAEFPPFEYVTAKGVIDQYAGIDIEIVKQIAEQNGMTARIENLEFDSLIMALKAGKLDGVIAGMTITEERKKSVAFSTPYFVAKQVMIVREGSDITKAADMAGKKIIVIQGYTGEISVKKMGLPFEAFKKASEAIIELKNKKCDVVVLDYAPARKYVSDTKGLVIREDDVAFGVEEYGIAVRKDNKTLLDKINATLDSMKSKGDIERIVQKYYDSTK